MNFRLLLESNIYNYPELEKIERDNKSLEERVIKKLDAELGYKINPQVLKILAYNKFLTCYDTMEFIRILDYFKQLKGR